MNDDPADRMDSWRFKFWLAVYSRQLAFEEAWLELRYRLRLTSKHDYRHPTNKDQWEPRGYSGR